MEARNISVFDFNFLIHTYRNMTNVSLSREVTLTFLLQIFNIDLEKPIVKLCNMILKYGIN
jgi:hypothetical protein